MTIETNKPRSGHGWNVATEGVIGAEDLLLHLIESARILKEMRMNLNRYHRNRTVSTKGAEHFRHLSKVARKMERSLLDVTFESEELIDLLNSHGL